MTSPLAERLLEQVLAGGSALARLSVIGLCKNAGKTVTLNHLVRAAAAHQVPLGLVSTGRDGEEQDAITELPKPRIWAPAGAWVATAKGALEAGTARVAVSKELKMSTPFGPIILGQVEQAGEVLLIGPGNARRIADVLDAIEALGARLSIVDGSFDRMAAAAPAITGRVVLAAGAAYSTSQAETLAQLRHVLDIFDLPAVAPDLAPIVDMSLGAGPVSVVNDDGEFSNLELPTALGDPAPIADAAEEMLEEDGVSHLVINGALGDRLLMTLIKRRLQDVSLVLNDPTHVLVDRNLWRRWRRLGGMAYVRRPVQVLAVTANPHSPVGQSYDARQFVQAIHDVAKRPVYDLEAGLCE